MAKSFYKKAGVFILLFVFINISEAQVIIEKEIKIEAERIWADSFDNLYVLSENVFIKYNSLGIKIGAFYSDNGEEISSADVRNPFKIILFYREQNKVCFLDNKLVKINSEVYLTEVGVLGDALIVGATTGGYWVYDKINSSLMKLAPDFKKEYKKYVNITREIRSITDNSSNVIFQTQGREYISYNINSGNKENLPIYKAAENYRVIEDVIIYYSGNLHGINLFTWKTQNSKNIILPKNISVSDAVLGKTKVFFFNKKGVYFSSIKEAENLMKK